MRPTPAAWLAAICAGLALAGCGSSMAPIDTSTALPSSQLTPGGAPSPTMSDTSSSTTASVPAPVTAAQATQFFRSNVAGQFNGTVATGDFRGCVRATPRGVWPATFSCTAYVQGQDIDVIGSVTASRDGGMSYEAHQTTGQAIQDWFAKTGGTSF
jgi:hypothetical protein